MAEQTNPHWCQLVVQEVQSSKITPPPPPPPPKFPKALKTKEEIPPPKLQISTPIISDPNSQTKNQQYLQYYQQYHPQYAAMFAANPAYAQQYSAYYSSLYQHQQQQQQVQQLQQLHQPQISNESATSTSLKIKKPSSSRFSSTPPLETSTLKPSGVITTETEKEKEKEKVPPTLKQFVTRCFSACKSKEEKEIMGKKLEELVSKVAAEGRLFIHRWDLENISLNASPSHNLASNIVSTTNSLTKSDSTGRQKRSRFEEPPPSASSSSSSSTYSPSSPYTPSSNSTTSTSSRFYTPSPYLPSTTTTISSTKSLSFPSSSSSSSPSYSSSPSLNPQSHGSILYSKPERKVKENENKGIDEEEEEEEDEGEDYIPLSSSLSFSYPASKLKQGIKLTKREKKILKQQSKLERTQNEKPAPSTTSFISSFEIDDHQKEKRASRFQKEEAQRERERMEREMFSAAGSRVSRKASRFMQSEPGEGGGGIESLQIVGTCQKLEKEYFRLTSQPDPSTVRPEPVLQLALSALTAKWKEKAIDYPALCSQLKAIRQDLTVQGIQSEFTVLVYESHARISLETNDIAEYNQCQTQLKHLYYGLNLGQFENQMEFLGYHILYLLKISAERHRFQRGNQDLAVLLTEIDEKEKHHPSVAHALLLRKHFHLENYSQFFRVSQHTPNLGYLLVQGMLDDLRVLTLQKMMKAYKPTISLDFTLKTLGYDLTILEKIEDGIEFLKKVGCVFIQPSSPSSSDHHKHHHHHQRPKLVSFGAGFVIDTKVSVIGMPADP